MNNKRLFNGGSRLMKRICVIGFTDVAKVFPGDCLVASPAVDGAQDGKR